MYDVDKSRPPSLISLFDSLQSAAISVMKTEHLIILLLKKENIEVEKGVRWETDEPF